MSKHEINPDILCSCKVASILIEDPGLEPTCFLNRNQVILMKTHGLRCLICEQNELKDLTQ